MDLKCFDVIKDVVVSTKSKKFYDKDATITFVVGLEFNKLEVKSAVEQIWSVKVADVRTVIVKGREKKFTGRSFVTSSYKKAYVKLAAGYKIELPWDGISAASAGVNNYSPKTQGA